MKPTEEQLKKINLYTRRELKADEVFVFSVILCDNEIDRDYEQFSYDSLDILSELFIGKTGVFDSNPKAENQSARIFETELVSDGKNSLGERYYRLKAWAYMVRCDKNSDLILEIDAGIKKEVSVGCAVNNMSCSICGEDVKFRGCEHEKGTQYAVHGFNGRKYMTCHYILESPTDAYEWSFVTVPAAKKNKLNTERKSIMKKYFIVDDEGNSETYKTDSVNEAIYEHYKYVNCTNETIHKAILAMPTVELAIDLHNKVTEENNEITLIVDVENAIYVAKDED